MNGTIPSSPIENATYQRAEPFVIEISKEEVREAMKNLTNWKTPVSDRNFRIPSELIRYGEEDMYNFTYRIYHWVRLVSNARNLERSNNYTTP